MSQSPSKKLLTGDGSGEKKPELTLIEDADKPDETVV